MVAMPSSPPFAPFPPASIRFSLGPPEWEACLDAWLALAEHRLCLTSHEFLAAADKDKTLPVFLSTFYHELANLEPYDSSFGSSTAQSLRKASFKLAALMLTEVGAASQSLISWDFLSSFSYVHRRTSAIQQIMKSLWKRKEDTITTVLQTQKDFMIKSLDSSKPGDEIDLLTHLAPMMYASPSVGSLFMTGSDFLDSLATSYSRFSGQQQQLIVSVVYLGLIALVKIDTPNLSLLSDHLYGLKSQADGKVNGSSLLGDAVANTPLLRKLRQSIGTKTSGRLQTLFKSLEIYRSHRHANSTALNRRKRSKGKGKQIQPKGTLDVHRTSLVTQIQDFFPELGSGFVLKLLEEYEVDVEKVTAQLLDDSLPSHLASLDRSEQIRENDDDAQREIENLVPRSTPLLPPTFVPERRNVFDNDEFDRLEFNTSRLHIGKQNRSVTENDEPNKTAILSALATFDSDDDERDDTYDVEDVGGTIDSAHPDGEPGFAASITGETNDMALFSAYKASPELFARTNDIRRGPKRAALKVETGMTDEAIEGWAIMLQRDPRKLKRLEAQSGAFDGRQTELPSTAYREPVGGTEDEESDAMQHGERGGFRGRGRGRGGRGRGRGTAANVSDSANSAVANRRKEANKGSRANHNRRDQRAKKMNRAGAFPT